MRYIIGKRRSGIWVETRDAMVTSAHDSLKAFVGRPLHELLNWAIGKHIPYYVQEHDAAPAHKLNGFS